MSRWIWMAAGELLLWLALLDVFLTVLYARVGTSIVARHVAAWLWKLFRALSHLVPRWKDGVLSFSGPLILLAIIACWTWMMNLGAALIVYPNLGHAVRDTSGPTSTTFLTALYAGGISLSVVGSSNYAPQTTGFRMFYLLNSVVGTSVLSLTLTYLMQVYNALQRRSAVALQTHLSTGETGDAADLIAGIGPEGQFSVGYSRLSELSSAMSTLREFYSLYPVLLYFRYREPFYSVPRLALIVMDTVSLIKTGLNDEQCRWVKESSAPEELWRGCMKILTSLADAYLPEDANELSRRPADEEAVRHWRARYTAAIDRLRQAGITTAADPGAGADQYVELRTRWAPFIEAFTRFMDYDAPAIDPVGFDPSQVIRRPPFDARLHTVVRQPL